MTITAESAGTLAQIYAVGLLILAVEGRFLRDWSEITRTIVGWGAAVALTLTSMATVSLAQAVMFDQPVTGFSAEIVRYAGWSLVVIIGGFLVGALMHNAELLGPNRRREKERHEQLMLAIEAAVTHSLTMRDLERDSRKIGHAKGTKSKKTKPKRPEAND